LAALRIIARVAFFVGFLSAGRVMALPQLS